jgi:hypothetical protein
MELFSNRRARLQRTNRNDSEWDIEFEPADSDANAAHDVLCWVCSELGSTVSPYDDRKLSFVNEWLCHFLDLRCVVVDVRFDLAFNGILEQTRRPEYLVLDVWLYADHLLCIRSGLV